MRTRFRYISAALAAIVMLAGCESMDEITSLSDSCMTLTVNTCNPQLLVKSPVAGEDTYNENLMNTLHYFFFAKGSDSSTAVAKGSATGISETVSYTQEVPISSSDLNNNLFDADRKCNLFVIANAPESMKTLLAGNPTLAQLRAAAVVANLSNVPQSNFVMVYDGEIEIDSRADATAIDVEVEMKRLACKFTIKADVKKTISTTDGSRTATWTAATGSDALTVTLGNCINRTTPAGFDKGIVAETDYFDAGPVGMTFTAETSTAPVFNQYTAVAPIYSYPMDWVFTDQFEPYLLFDMVWMYEETEGGELKKQYPEHRYYKMILGQQSITANDWYVITAKLSALGNLLPRDPLVLLTGLNYSVDDWSNAFANESTPNTPANIKDTRFLMVPQTSWEVNNEKDCFIPISTSHPCEVVNVVVKKTVFFDENYKDPTNGNAARPNKPHDVTVVDWSNGLYDSSFSFTPNEDWSELTFSHELHNDLDDNLDISPYYVTLTVRHAEGDDAHEFSEDITLTQYPAIWVDSQLNSAGEEGKTQKGYVYVNGGQLTTSSAWYRVPGADGGASDSGSNTSRYMVVIHVSQFQSGASFTFKNVETGVDPDVEYYMVGDPRVSEVNNLDKQSSAGIQWTNQNPQKTTALFDNPTDGRQISYYYPTNTDREHRSYVAPVLRVCSGHGKMSANIAYALDEQRCASYQEDGYPAGRWRVPTMAEASLIIHLCENQFIPNLLTSGGRYAFAGGVCQDMKWGYTGNDLNVRCVYDEWYWSKVDEDLGRKYGAEKNFDSSKFVWGDVPRDYTIEP